MTTHSALSSELPLPKIEAVAFDMDGLMVNTEELYTIVGETILERRGLRFTSALKNAMMGLPGPQAWQLMIDREQLHDSIDTLEAESKEIFEQLLPERLQVMPGLPELLDLLDQRAMPRCVATSSTHEFARNVLGRVSVLERVDFVVTAADVANGKPSPDIYMEAARRMHVPIDQVLVLEDSHHGCQAGVQAGACTIAVPGPHSVSHDFSGAFGRADSLVDRLILDRLGG